MRLLLEIGKLSNCLEAKKADAVKYLIELGADVSILDNKHHTALDYANALGLTQLIGEMSKYSTGTTDAYGNTPLHQSCYNGQSEVVKAMLAEKTVDINVCNDEGITPLYFAVMRNNLFITELLLEAGADADKKDNHGNTPLHLAARNENEHIVKRLLENGADANARTERGETALIAAAKTGNNYVAAALLSALADVSCKDTSGHTALYYAAEGGYNDIVEKLLAAGAEE